MAMRFAIPVVAAAIAAPACAAPATSTGQLTAFSQTPEACTAPCGSGAWNGYVASVDDAGHVAIQSMAGGGTAAGTLTEFGSTQLGALIEVLPIDASDSGTGQTGVIMELHIDFTHGGPHKYEVAVDNPGLFGALTVFLDDVAVALMDDAQSELVTAGTTD
jgi:hypothetical protein